MCRKVLIVVGILCFLSSARANADDFVYAYCPLGEGYVFLYDTPTGFQVMANLKCGQKLTVLGVGGTDRVQVRTADGKEGYVQKPSLTGALPGTRQQPAAPPNTTTPQPQAPPQPQTQPAQPKQQAQPRLQVQAQPPQPQPPSQPQALPQTPIQVQPKVEGQPQQQPQPQLEARTEPQAQSEPLAQPVAQPQVQIEPPAQQQSEGPQRQQAQPQPQPEAHPEPQAQSESSAQPAQPELEAQPQRQAQSQPEPEAQLDRPAQPEPQLQAELKSQPKRAEPRRGPEPAAAAFTPYSGLGYGPNVPRLEVFGGLSYLNAGTKALTSRQNVVGFGGSVAVNVKTWLGGEADFGGYYKTLTIVNVGTFAFHDYTAMAGPRFNMRKAFFHALVGMDHLPCSAIFYSPGASSCATPGYSDTALAGAAGGGVHWSIARRLALRASADYLMSRFGGVMQNNFSVTLGVVFEAGSVRGE